MRAVGGRKGLFISRLADHHKILDKQKGFIGVLLCEMRDCHFSSLVSMIPYGFHDVWGGIGLPMPFFWTKISISVTESLEKNKDFCPDRQARVNLRDPKALANFLIHSDIKLIRAEYGTQTWPSTTSLIVVTSDPSGPA